MYSAFYRYINMYPIVHSDTLPTANIESIIKVYNIFEEREKGAFYNNINTGTHISIQLMKVSDHNSWSSNDFDSKETSSFNFEFNLLILSLSLVGCTPEEAFFNG